VAPVNRENHETVECTAKVVACRAADVGCEFACVRGAMQEHEDKCVVVVLRTILQRQRDAMQQLSRSIEEQQTTLRQQQGEIAALKKQVKALKTRKQSSSDAGSLYEHCLTFTL
jgi:septal ring factor EnvC (AmiA/AmiB activator)